MRKCLRLDHHHFFSKGEVSFSAVDALDAENEQAWQENHQEKDQHDQ